MATGAKRMAAASPPGAGGIAPAPAAPPRRLARPAAWAGPGANLLPALEAMLEKGK